MVVALLTAIGLLSAAALIALALWMRRDRRPRWEFIYGHGRPIDERLSLAIAVFVDAVFAGLLVAEGANGLAWIVFVIIVAAQFTWCGLWLGLAARRQGPRVWRGFL